MKISAINSIPATLYNEEFLAKLAESAAGSRDANLPQPAWRMLFGDEVLREHAREMLAIIIKNSKGKVEVNNEAMRAAITGLPAQKVYQGFVGLFGEVMPAYDTNAESLGLKIKMHMLSLLDGKWSTLKRNNAEDAEKNKN